MWVAWPHVLNQSHFTGGARPGRIFTAEDAPHVGKKNKNLAK